MALDSGNLRAFRPPRLRVAEGDGQPRRATWLELLYDLVFVAAVAELGNQLTGQLGWGDLARFTALFVPVWWAWVGQTFYANRFDSDDLGHRLLAVVQMVAVAALAASVQDATGQRAATFVLAYVAIRLVLVAQYLRVRRHVPEARPLVGRYVSGFLLAAGLWLCSLAVPPPGRYLVWAVATVVDLATPLTSRHLQAAMPPQPQHLPERFGLFIIIVLGESVAGVVFGLSAQPAWRPATLAAAGLAMLLAMSLWWLYFENLRESVVRRLLVAGQVWVYAHLPLAVAITAIGAALELTVAHPGGSRPLPERWLLAGSVALAFVLLAVLHTRSLGPGRAMPRLATALACLALGAAGGRLSAVGLLAGLTLVAWIQVALDLHHSGRLTTNPPAGSTEEDLAHG